MARKAKRRGKSGTGKAGSAAEQNRRPGFPERLALPRSGTSGGSPGAARRAMALHNAQRLAAADNMDPLDYRAQHRALEGDHGPAVERYGPSLRDAGGRIGTPHRTYDTLATLLRNGSIGSAEHDAGRAFEEDFRRARLDPLHASNPARIPAGGVTDLTDAMVVGRRRVKSAMTSLGGMATVAGSAVWAVLGTGRTVKEWAGDRQFGKDGRSLDEKVAKGIFVAALGVLAAHYGTLGRGARRGRGDSAGLGP